MQQKPYVAIKLIYYLVLYTKFADQKFVWIRMSSYLILVFHNLWIITRIACEYRLLWKEVKDQL